MHAIYPTSPDDALYNVFRLLRNTQPTPSRNGLVLRVAEPVVTVWDAGCTRVSLLPARNANPFFHVMEAMWMLAGREDLAPLIHYNSRMAEFSDDGGVTQPGAYGWRWRNAFGYDQLAEIINRLRKNSYDRRCVLTMWSPTDLSVADTSKDVPCNTHIYFDTSDEGLEMTVCCRSNDAVWGAYGANVVHFSFLHEFVATAVGLPRGRMYQLSNNLHVYPEREDVRRLKDALEVGAGWIRPPTTQLPLVASTNEAQHWLESNVFSTVVDGDFNREVLRLPFVREIVYPLSEAWNWHKEKETLRAIDILGGSQNEWVTAGRLWLQRALERQK